MYSQVNQGMWCCVGTGMENHSKYGEFVYAHSLGNDTLFVNLFVASTLDHATFGLEQKTGFPYEEKTTLVINKAGNYNLAVRRPEWCKGDYKILVNGTEQEVAAEPGTYACLNRAWAVGDEIEVRLPMALDLEVCPNNKAYVAFRYGPVLLGAKTHTENLVGQFAGEGRMDHAPSLGTQLSLTSAPMLIGEREEVLKSVYMVDKEKLHFKIKQEMYNTPKFADLILQPFFTVHEARYMMYWNQLTQDEWDAVKDEVIAEEQAAQRLKDRTLDFVSTGEQQSDAGHVLLGDFEKGSYSGEFYIDALKGKWFSYQLATQGVSEGVSLMCRYHSADAGRVYTLSVNGKVFKEIKLEKTSFTGFYNVEYLLTPDMLKDEDGKVLDYVTVKFEATGTTPTPGIYYLRLLKDYQYPKPYSYVCRQWVSGDAARVNRVEYTPEENAIKVYGKPGENNIALQYSKWYNDSTYLRASQRFFLIKGTDLKVGPKLAYLWWLNGANHGTQVAPTYTYQNTQGETFMIWDVTKTGLDDFLKEDSVGFSNQGNTANTIFGLTSSAEDNSAVITDISFYSVGQLIDKYPELKETVRINVFDENSQTFEVNRIFRNVLVKKLMEKDKWTALCLPFSMGRTLAGDYFAEMKSFVGLAKGDDGTLTLYFEDATNVESAGLYLVKAKQTMEEMELYSIRSFATTEPEPLVTDNVKVQGTYALREASMGAYRYENGAWEECSGSEDIKGLNMFVQLSEEDINAINRVVVSFDKMPDAIVRVAQDAEKAEVYSLNGIKLREKGSVEKQLEGLPQGIYIINGKKVVK